MDILKTILEKRADNKIIGFTASTFDLLHPGHIDMLAQAKSECDYLIVGLLTNPTISRQDKMEPYETTFERFIRLQAVSYVDLIIPFDTEEDLENMIKIIMPDKRFVGEEYSGKPHTGYNIEGVEIIYNKRRHNYSSTNIKNRIK